MKIKYICFVSVCFAIGCLGCLLGCNKKNQVVSSVVDNKTGEEPLPEEEFEIQINSLLYQIYLQTHESVYHEKYNGEKMLSDRREDDFNVLLIHYFLFPLLEKAYGIKAGCRMYDFE